MKLLDSYYQVIAANPLDGKMWPAQPGKSRGPPMTVSTDLGHGSAPLSGDKDPLDQV